MMVVMTTMMIYIIDHLSRHTVHWSGTGGAGGHGKTTIPAMKMSSSNGNNEPAEAELGEETSVLFSSSSSIRISWSLQ